MSPPTRTLAATEEGHVRFNLLVQRSRAATYVLTVIVFLVGRLAGSVNGDLRTYLLLMSVGVFSAVVCHALYARKVDLRRGWRLDLFCEVFDVTIITLSIPITGGIESSWYIWQLTNASTAAFIGGKRAVIAVSAANILSYIGILAVTGQITGVNETLYLAIFRMLFLYGAASFLLAGIANLHEKRLVIRRMRAEEQKKIEELTRLTEELDERTRELGEANLRIREADRAKSQFLANMSHELRTPMNSIIGFSEILLERLEPEIPPRYVDFLRHILSSGQHLLAIINDVLDLSKIEAGKMEIFPERFAIAPVITGVCNVMHAQTTSKDIAFDIDIPRDLPQIETDLAKFKQVLYNLVSNAVKFSPEHSRITIAARADESATPPSVTVSVTDRGVGIAPEHQQLIFEEFRQIDSTSRRQAGGTGLGLALVKRFIEMQHGSVSVESELGKGSCFRVTVPIDYAGKYERLTFAEQRLAPALGERVLVVEDDNTAFDAISDHLASGGYVSVRARHGDEALRLARTIQPVAITLDLVLPGLDGWEVLKQLKADPTTCEIPVVIVSMVDHRELGLALGAHDYFVKPVDRARLVERVRQFTAPSPRRTRLLIIDDDKQFHAMIREELKSHGYDLDSAFGGQEGLDKAASTHPDVVILDLMMPGMSGFEVAEMLKRKRETSAIPILVMTSKELTAADRSALQSRISGLIPKGQSKARLLGAIQELERLRARDAAR